MQVCNPQEIRQTHSQYPPHSTVSIDKTLITHEAYLRKYVIFKYVEIP